MLQTLQIFAGKPQDRAQTGNINIDLQASLPQTSRRMALCEGGEEKRAGMGRSKNPREDPFQLKPLISGKEIPSEGPGADPKDASLGQKEECFSWIRVSEERGGLGAKPEPCRKKSRCSALAFNLLKGFTRAKPRSNPNCSFQQPHRGDPEPPRKGYGPAG